MRQIILIRHAKSSWKYELKDFDRPLNNIGTQRATRMSLETKNLVNDNFIIWSSTAKRAKDTCKIFVNNWKLYSNEVVYIDGLYVFEGDELEKIVKSCSDNVNNLILFGHNNAITCFVNKFGSIFVENVPTAGFVSILFDTTSWSLIKKGVTDKIIFPRDI